MKLQRIAPGHYVVGDRFEILRVREGALHASGIAWLWRDRDNRNSSGAWRDTLAEAKADLAAHLKGGAR
jgi:hypothetical protein